MRRDRSVWLLICAVIASCVGYGASQIWGTSTAASRTGPTSTADSARFGFAATGAPFALVYQVGGIQSFSAVDGELQIAGMSTDNGPAAVSDCFLVAIDPSTLKVDRSSSEPCSDPSSVGRRVWPVVDYGPNTGTVQIAVRSANGVGQVGPSVMCFPAISDTNPEWLYADGSLWLYDLSCDAAGKGTLLRISDSTGAVIQSIATPLITRPVIAADSDGFFMGSAGNSLGDASGLYFVRTGSTQAIRLDGPGSEPNASDTVYWMLASGSHLYADVSAQPSFGTPTGTIWRFDGSTPTVAFHVPDHGAGIHANDILPDTSTGYSRAVTGDATDGLWTVAALSESCKLKTAIREFRGCYDWNVIQIDPSSGHVQATPIDPASFPLQDSDGFGLTYFDGSLYILNPAVPEVFRLHL